MSDARATRASGPSLTAGGTIIPMRAIKLDTTAEYTALAAGAGDKMIGVAPPYQKRAPGLTGSDTDIAAESGDQLDYYGPGDVAPVVAGAAISIGANVKASTSGKVVTATTGWVGGIAMTAANADGDVVYVWLQSPYYIA